MNWKSQVPDYTFVGLKNWIRMFNDRRFHIDLRNLVFYAIGFMTQCIVFGFLLATLLDQKIKGEAFFRTVFIFPFAVSGIVTGVAWRWLMQPTTGINLLFAQGWHGLVSAQLEFGPPIWHVGGDDCRLLAIHRLCHGALSGWAAWHPQLNCARLPPLMARGPGPPIATLSSRC